MLHQNYPNPFNPETTIRFDLAQNVPVRIDIYNVTGQLVRRLVEADRQAGSYQVVWNGRNDDRQLLPSGIYFCRLTAGQFTEVKKMALIK
jgi:flagellar hook assembly protein FlgD